MVVLQALAHKTAGAIGVLRRHVEESDHDRDRATVERDQAEVPTVHRESKKRDVS